MSDKPIVGRHVDPPEPHKPEGVVLFKPAPMSGGDQIEIVEEGPPPFPWIAVVLVIAALSVAGYGVWQVTSAQPVAEPLMPDAGVVVDLRGPDEGIHPLAQAETRALAGTMVPVGVQVNRSGGFPIADSIVQFRIETGGGTLEPGDVLTGADGIATTRLRLPDSPGTVVLSASLLGSEMPPARMVFVAEAGVPVRMELIAGAGQSAEVSQMLPVRFAVLVTDDRGNPVEDVRVSFDVEEGAGMAAPTRVRTNADGEAVTTWRLGLNEGEQAMAISAQSLSTIRVTATALPSTEVVQLGARDRGIEQTTTVNVVPKSYAVGGSHVCRSTAAGTECRGSNDRGQLIGTEGRSFVALYSGVNHVCGLDGVGVATCWGANESGQLGNGERADRREPTPVRTELRFEALTAGVGHTCGLVGGGTPVCWGDNISGQLGDGTRNDQRGPRTVGQGLSFVQLVAGWNHTCGVTASRNVFCWGSNSQGQLGDGSRLDRLAPTTVANDVRMLVAGSTHTCGLTSRGVQCWGSNSAGQLGTGTTEDASLPANVMGLPSVPTAITAGAVHTCALLDDGRAFCWGQNGQGQLGDGTTENRFAPRPVAGSLRFREIHAGGALTCGITTGGEEYCWGLNQNGQVGDGTRTSRSTPTRVGGAP